MSYRKQVPIAIVGMAGRFPQAETLNDYWNLISSGKDAITKVPNERWDADDLFHPIKGETGKISSFNGGFLKDVEKFDANFFGIEKDEAKSMDPQQRIMLMLSWQALEDAMIRPSTLIKSKTGVFIGACSWDYNKLSNRDLNILDKHIGPGTGMGIIANRISYFLKTQGPSLVIDTACSSSLVALHYACISLEIGECNLALAGGVNLVLSPETSVTFSAAGMLSDSGHCKTFSDQADGYVRSEGAGIVVLKRLNDAIAAKDNILGIIRGSAINHNGMSNGLTAPNGPAQHDVINESIKRAGISANQISFVETHGTGTKIGDSIEVNTLKKILDITGSQPCALSGVKANIGHPEAASGIAGLIKVLLCFKHKQVPPQIHIESLNPSIEKILNNTSLYISRSLSCWKPKDSQYFASLSAFGFGGVNASFILEAPGNIISEKSLKQSGNRPIDDNKLPYYILKISAKSEVSLKKLAENYYCELKSEKIDGYNLCQSVNVTRDDFEYRDILISYSKKNLLQLLDNIKNNSYEAIKSQRKVVFNFPDQTKYSPFKGETLFKSSVAFRSAIKECDEILKSSHVISLDELMFNEAMTSHIPSSWGYVLNFVLHYSTAKMWLALGVEPYAVAGQGVGKLSAACIAGYISLKDSLDLLTYTEIFSDDFYSAISNLALKAQEYRLFFGEKSDFFSDKDSLESYFSSYPENSKDFFEKKGISFCIDCSFEEQMLKNMTTLSSNEKNLKLLNKSDCGTILFLKELSDLYLHGLPIDWDVLCAFNEKIQTPVYPFDVKSYFLHLKKNPVIMRTTQNSQISFTLE